MEVRHEIRIVERLAPKGGWLDAIGNDERINLSGEAFLQGHGRNFVGLFRRCQEDDSYCVCRRGPTIVGSVSDVRELIRKLLDENRIPLREGSVRLGKNHAYLQQYLERGVPRLLPESVREELAHLLKIDPDHLKKLESGKLAGNSRLMPMRMPPAIPGDKIKVLGAAEGGADGQLQWNGEVVDYIDRPPQLAQAPNGYATYVFGTSMEPRYHPGEIVYMHPGRPLTAGCYVLVQIQPKQPGDPPGAYVKRYVRRTPTKLVVEQLNPSKEIEFPLKDVLAIHRIVGSGE